MSILQRIIQSQVANCVNEDLQNQATSFNVDARSQLKSLRAIGGTYVEAIDESLAATLDESAVDNPIIVTVKHLDSFDAKCLQIPK
jgi:hypothetical protein